jgi:hypothetical protein
VLPELQRTAEHVKRRFDQLLSGDSSHQLAVMVEGCCRGHGGTVVRRGGRVPGICKAETRQQPDDEVWWVAVLILSAAASSAAG